MDETFAEKVIDTFQVAGAALQQHEKAAADQLATAEKVAAEIPATVKALLDNKLIEPEEKEACERALRDPVQTLRLLKQAAEFQPTPILAGQPVDKTGRSPQEKTASSKMGGGYVGRRGEQSQAWDGFSAALGIR